MGNSSFPIDVAPLQRLQPAWAPARLKPKLEHGPFVGAAGLEDGLALSRAERRPHIVAGLCRLPNELAAALRLYACTVRAFRDR